MRRMRGAVYPRFQPGQILPGMCRTHEADQRRKAAEERQRRMERIKRRKAQGLQDRYLYDYTFANDNGQNPLMDKARAYVENWKEAYRNNTGLLLFGDVGTGKSFFAGCIANALLDRDVPVLMTNFPTILNRLTGMFSDDRADFIASFDEYDLLIIDDLGVRNILCVQWPHAVQPPRDLVNIDTNLLQFGGLRPDVGGVDVDNITIYRHFSQIGGHIPGWYQFHFFSNQPPFFFRHIKFDLHGSFSAFHSFYSPFRFKGLGHFPTSCFAEQNTEVGTHFLCLLQQPFPRFPLY